VKNENGDLLADSHNILNRYKNEFSQFLAVFRISDVRQTGILIAKPLVPHSTPPELEIAVAKLEGTNLQVMTKFWKNLSTQVVKHCSLRSLNSSILARVYYNTN
jgi:hypothetical protein